MRPLLTWLRDSLRRRRSPHRDLDDELAAHVALGTDAHVASGLSPADARRAALRSLGSPLHIKEATYERLGRPWLESLGQDVRYACRGFLRAPLIPVVIVATLGLGLGLNIVVFSVFNGLLFRPQVSQDSSSFVRIYVTVSGDRNRGVYGSRHAATVEEYEALRTAVRTLSSLTASKAQGFVTDRTSRLAGRFVSCNYLTAHHGPIVLGRGLLPSDCAPNAGPPVAVLSRRGWTVAFGGEPTIVGQPVRFGPSVFTIVGVTGDDLVGEPLLPLVYVPYTSASLVMPHSDFFQGPAKSALGWLDLQGRLAPGISRRVAQQEIEALLAPFDRQRPGRRTRVTATDGSLFSEPDATGSLSVVVALAVGTAALILLLACANVATVLLARGLTRQQELGVRLALGASGGRVVRQLLSETMLLVLVATVASVIVGAYAAGPVAQGLTSFPVGADFRPDWRVVTFAAMVAVVATTAAGVSPALVAFRRGLMTGLRSTGATLATRDSHGVLARHQISITLALVVGTALAVRAEQRILRPLLGYDPLQVLAVTTDVSDRHDSPFVRQALLERLVDRVRRLPHVDAVATTSAAPFEPPLRATFSSTGDRSVVGWTKAVSPSYFPLTGTRLIRGEVRSFERAQTPRTEIPVVASETLARSMFGDADPVGQTLRVSAQYTGRIVGVVADVSSVRPGEADGPMLYRPIDLGDRVPVTVLARTSGTPRSASEAAAQVLREEAADAPSHVEMVADILARTASQFDAALTLLEASSLLALGLAFIGLFGTSQYATKARAREVGVRVALGAQRHQIVGLFLRSLTGPLVKGLGTGLPMAVLVGVLLQRSHVLIAVDAADPWPYVVAILLVAGTVGIATLLPAMQAAFGAPPRHHLD